jgi:hypothetical protein
VSRRKNYEAYLLGIVGMELIILANIIDYPLKIIWKKETVD